MLTPHTENSKPLGHNSCGSFPESPKESSPGTDTVVELVPTGDAPRQGTRN